jgi:antitoxin (DNA-binding transcriptional repressor) of toxin-antitoxin stability system
MVCLSVDDAQKNLADCVERAMAGEKIGIVSRGKIVELTPLPEHTASLTPREVIEEIKKKPLLARAEADAWCAEIREQRKAWRR